MGLFMDIFRPVFLISTLTLLTACGGGGGGGGDNPAPTLHALPTQLLVTHYTLISGT
jgi:hypothetical protein